MDRCQLQVKLQRTGNVFACAAPGAVVATLTLEALFTVNHEYPAIGRNLFMIAVRSEIARLKSEVCEQVKRCRFQQLSLKSMPDDS